MAGPARLPRARHHLRIPPSPAEPRRAPAASALRPRRARGGGGAAGSALEPPNRRWSPARVPARCRGTAEPRRSPPEPSRGAGWVMRDGDG